MIVFISLAIGAMGAKGATGAEVCPAFTCELPTDYIEESTCVFFKEDLAVPTYYASKCFDLNKSFCPPAYGKNSTCTSQPKALVLKYPGEKCHSDDDCGEFTKGCKGQVCQGIVKGQSCKGHEYCNPGLRCAGTCLDQLKIGSSGCKSDFDCENSAGCNISPSSPSGTCIEYFSLTDFSILSSCQNNTNFLCSSSSCSSKQCVPAATSSSIPSKCQQDSDCGSSDSSVQGTCLCGRNRNGNKYCSLLPGDKWNQLYFGLSKKWFHSGFVHKCNSARRFSYVCAGDWWDRKSSYLMNYYLFFSTQFPSVVEFDECIGEIYLRQFLDVRAMLDNILVIDDFLPLFLPLTFFIII